MNEIIKNKINEEKFLEKLIFLETEKDVKDLFLQECDIDLSDSDIQEIKNFVQKTMEVSRKLSEETMENVSGGGQLKDIAEKVVDDTNKIFFEGKDSFLSKNKSDISEGLLVGSGVLTGALLSSGVIYTAYKVKNWWNKKDK